jgi:transmembrane sensor
MLAPHSTMVTTDFAKNRTVALTGEAYFDVTHASGVPFLVTTGHVTTRVLGTAFDVRHYASDRTTQVAVLSGKVTVAGQYAPVTISAGAIIRATDSTVIRVADANLADATAWVRGQLVFTETRVSDMLTVVGQWYGYEFRLRDSSLARQHVTVTFETNAAAMTLLMLRQLLGVSMDVRERIVTLTPSPKPAMRSPVRQLRRDSLSLPSEVGR